MLSPQVFKRDIHDARCDDRFHKTARQTQDAKTGNGQRDRMRERKTGDDDDGTAQVSAHQQQRSQEESDRYLVRFSLDLRR